MSDATAPAAPAQPQRSRAQNFFESFGAWVVGAVVALLGTIVQARILGVSGRGQVVFLTVLMNLTMFVSMFGVHNSHANILGQEPERARNVTTNSVVFALVLSTVIAALAGLILAIIPSKVMQQVGWPLTLFALGGVWILVLQTYLRSLAIAQYQFRIANGSMLVVPVFTLLVNVGLGIAGALTVSLALAAWIVGQAIALVILLVWVRREIGFGPFDRRLAGRSFSFGAKNHLSTTMQLANFRLDQLFVGGIGGSATLGIYSVAVALAETMFYLPEVASQIQRPDLVRAEKKNAAADAAFGLRITLIALAPLLVNGLFGSEFSAATAQLRVLVPGAIGVATVKLLSSALVSQNHPLASSIAIAFSLATTITLDLLLIPAHGGMGAAIASTTAYWVGGLLTAVVFVRIFKISPRLLLPSANDVRALVTPIREKLARRGAH